jgi:hypothetical protein
MIIAYKCKLLYLFFDLVLCIISSHLYASILMFLKTVYSFDIDSTLRKLSGVLVFLCKFISLKYRTKLISFLKKLRTFNYAFVKLHRLFT